MLRCFLVNKPDWMGELGEASFVRDCFPPSDAGSGFSYSVHISSPISGTGCYVCFSSGCEIYPMVRDIPYGSVLPLGGYGEGEGALWDGGDSRQAP